jgi:DNA polymerase-1
VEEWGVPLDRQAAEFFRSMAAAQVEAALVRVRKYRADLNVNSPDQVADLLFRELGLDSTVASETGKQSTSEEALAAIAGQHPVVEDLLTFRHHQKLVGYAEDWLRCVRADGRIHPSILLDGARSGRTSCSDPNLQNIPRADTDDGKRARDCFVAPRGHVLVQLDYSQLELRMAAWISDDTAMADLFRSGVDFHLGTAKLISKVAWGIEPENVTKLHRTGAKEYNFGLAYGKTDGTMANALGITLTQAAAIRQAIFGKFVRYGKWMKAVTAEALATGGCWTYWEGERARWRPLWRIADDREEARGQQITAKNGAVNSPIQGTASELCVASITKVVNLIDAGQMDAQLVLPVHDSLMLVAPEKSWRDVALAAREQMMSYPWVTSRVPLEVDVEVGTKWGSLEKQKL